MIVSIMVDEMAFAVNKLQKVGVVQTDNNIQGNDIAQGATVELMSILSKFIKEIKLDNNQKINDWKLQVITAAAKSNPIAAVAVFHHEPTLKFMIEYYWAVKEIADLYPEIAGFIYNQTGFIEIMELGGLSYERPTYG
jgi:hypothetical protein